MTSVSAPKRSPTVRDVSHEKLAELLGISRQRVAVLLERGMPRRSAGEAVQWYVAERLKTSSGTKAQRDAVALEREELELARLKRTVVPVEEFTQAVDEVYMRLNANLTALPKRLAARCAGKDQAAVERLLEEAIEALKATLRKGEA